MTRASDRANLSRAGGADAALRAAAAAGALALLGALVWVGVVALRPLPEPVIADPPAPGVIPAPAFSPATVESRDRLLGSLAGAGNIFAPDRAPWPTPTQQVASNNDSASALEPSPVVSAPPVSTPTARAAVAAAPAYDSIPVESAPPPAIERDLKKLRLRGVYRDGASRVALITGAPSNSARAVPRRVGETFGEESWTVIAIDDARPRVILSRAGVNVELSMRDLGDAIALTATKREPVAQPAPPAVVVHTRTPEQARADLLAAGVDPTLIEETLALAADDALADASAPDRPTPIDTIPRASDEMIELLKMMSAGSGAPTQRVVPSQLRNRNQSEKKPDKSGG